VFHLQRLRRHHHLHRCAVFWLGDRAEDSELDDLMFEGFVVCAWKETFVANWLRPRVSLNQNYICIQGDFAKDIFSFVKIDETIPCCIKNDPPT